MAGGPLPIIAPGPSPLQIQPPPHLSIHATDMHQCIVGSGTTVVAHYYSELVGFFTRSLGDREAAADVVQESYARVLAMGARSVAVRDLRALLFRTGKNIVIDGARRRQAEARMLETLALICADMGPCAEQQASARQQLERLSRRLAAMPRKRREAFVLVRIYGFSHAEAAAHMQSTEAAIEKHIVRAVCDCMGLSPRRAAR